MVARDCKQKRILPLPSTALNYILGLKLMTLT
ncbi:hypothetical protein HCH_05637 [Hahella chejuensis KCTC 2396]|uniref:Uncharacterized protein n=1 Tax=Hahella chejuensis (strain KCTC 2396) TaxID=349521 RepID=Q2SAM9_HAHCH|nr:hypothetical protein HCH_05637 [Hahella chejuensis KCTC 2396]